MMAKWLWWVLLPVLSSAVYAAEIRPYGEQNCVYQGEVNKSAKPEGMGAWSCHDGRVYTGHFKNGMFEGHGSYVVPDRSGLVLNPFGGMNSEKLLGMTIEGTFHHNQADGVLVASKNGEQQLLLKFEHGQLASVNVPKVKKSRKK